MGLHNEVEEKQESLDYKKIVASAPFQELLAAKKKFTLSTTIFFLVFALLLPVLAFYSDILTKPLFGAFSWAWLFAFAQFAMTWGICHLYIKKAAKFDEMAEKVLEAEEGGQANGY